MENPSLSSICWSCKGLANGIFCATCGAVQPLPSSMTAFNILGIDARFDVDKNKLEDAYLKRQMKLHPDRFSAKSKTEQLHALTWGSALNDGYNTLKDDVSRGVLLLSAHGEDDVLGRYRTLPQELMMYQLDVRERMADGEDISAEVAERYKTCYNALAAAFDEGNIPNAIEKTVELKFLSKLKEK